MSNTMPIEWHEKNLENARNYELRLIEELNALEDKIDKTLTRNDFLQKQIMQAKLEGKQSFDSEKYLKTRKIK